MRIVFLCLGMPFNGDTIKNRSLGGSESAAYYQCRELAARGHEVCLFTNIRPEEAGIYDGVTYLDAGEINQQSPLGNKFEWYARNTDHDVLIIQRAPHAFHGQFASRINILQMHDLAHYRNQAIVNFGMWNTNAITCVSEWHKKQVVEVYGVNPDFVHVVRNGVDSELYRLKIEGTNTDWDKAVSSANGFKLLYQSRPERGLENLVREGGIMDQLRDTNAHLFVCAYDNTVQEMVPYYQKLAQDIARLPNVTQLGALTKAQLAQVQMRCDLLVYPTSFKEVSCISVMEACHAALPVLTTDSGALKETLQDAGALTTLLHDGKPDIQYFANAIRSFAIHGTAALREAQFAAAHRMTWVKAVDQLENVIRDCFVKARPSVGAVARHAIEHSDIELAYRSLLEGVIEDGIRAKTQDEIIDLYAFAQSPEAYSAHYAKHQTAYYNDFEDKVIGEDITGSTRYRGVGMFFYKESMRRNGQRLRVLDYGCAHGHYLVPLSKDFPNCDFVGVDVSVRAIGACFKWIQREGIKAELHVGDESILTDLNKLCPYVRTDEVLSTKDDGEPIYAVKRKLFDVIYAGEVVEHVPDYHALLEKFRNLLAPGGILIITTPTGRWEWTGTESFRTAREHLKHFDRADIRKICGENEFEIASAPAGNDKTGKPLGSFVWMVRPHTVFNRVDYSEKLSQITPRQTVSACIIVKNGEKTIRKCIESLIDWVDEVVVGVDPDTSDRTALIVKNLEVDYPHKAITIFKGKRALVDGFDAARNATVEKACGDWILWIDADEELQQPWNLWKYLRHSQIDGFAFPQVHYSCDPPTVLTTDFPCRVFRNNGKIKFYGMVHEHPETEPGKAVPFGVVRHDVQFLHCGYVDEETRRKRFMRNLPLLYKDVEKYPDRSLNRFLMLRDIAQMLMFEHEQTGGNILQHHPAQAEHGIKLWQEILEKDHLRLAIDSLKYYSHCCAVLGKGFEASFEFKAKPDGCPNMAVNTKVEGRFFSREHFKKLLDKIHQESTANYESEYF